MKIIYIIVSLLSAFSLIASNNSEDHFLHGLCRFGAFYPTEEHPLTEAMLEHGRKNAAQIIELVEGGPWGTLLILGPGPGNDLPLSYLVERFQKVIMIDGFLDPMREWVGNNPAFKDKITLIQYDLSGGFYSYIADNRESALNALSKDIFSSDKSKICETTNYQHFIFGHQYLLEFSCYNPDVIISSLVTSQISIIGELKHYILVNEAFSRVKDAMESHEYDKINIKESVFIATYHDNRYLHANTYYTALIESNAQKIYFSDTIRPGHLPEKLFDQFCTNIEKKYNIIAYKKNAWLYKTDLPVCYVSFVQKQQCHQCELYVDKVQLCSRCKKAKYCSNECQVKDWSKHKINCQ